MCVCVWSPKPGPRRHCKDRSERRKGKMTHRVQVQIENEDESEMGPCNQESELQRQQDDDDDARVCYSLDEDEDQTETMIDKTDSGGDNGGAEAPDGGWGWVVAFATAMIMMFIPVMGPCFGVLFSRYLLHAGASSTLTSWIFGLQTLLWNMSSLFLRALSQEFGWRPVGIGGCLMASLGFTITAFTPAPEFLLFSFSIMCGLGGGVVTTLCFNVVPHYFKRRRGVAYAIMMGGSGVGQIVVPPLTVFLQETFGDRGATLVYSGIMLNTCIAALTLHPVHWHTKSKGAMTTEDKNEVTAVIPRSTKTTESNKSKSNIIVRVAKSAWSDLGILKWMQASIICFSDALIIVNILNFQMLVPFAMQDAGHSLEDAAWCITIMAVSNLIARLLCAALSDLKCFSVRTCFISGCAMMTLASAVFPYLRSLESIMVVMAGYGIGNGANMAMYSLIMIEVVGLKNFASMFGTNSFTNGIFLVIFGPLIGVIRDASQSYAVSIWVLSGLGLIGTLLLTLLRQAAKFDTRRRGKINPDV